MNGLQGIRCILKTDISWGLQKFGLILENKVHINLKLEKGIINISCSYNLEFIWKTIFEQHGLIFYSKN